MNLKRFARIASISAIILVLAGGAFSCKKQTEENSLPAKPLVIFDNVSPEARRVIMEYLQSPEAGFSVSPKEWPVENKNLTDLFTGEKFHGDILFTADMIQLKKSEALLAELDEQNTGLLPSSIRRIGIIEDSRKALPLLLDHLEMAVNNQLFSLMASGPSLALGDWERQLQNQAATSYYPLLIAGKDDLALLDIIAALTVSLTNGEALEKLLLFASEYKDGDDFGNFLARDLGNGHTPEPILQKLKSWEANGILHPEWLDLDAGTVQRLAEDKITGSIFMRLSQHRSFPRQIIENFTDLPFPLYQPTGITADIACIPLVGALPENSRFKDEARKALATMITADMQKKLSAATGLAPVNASVAAPDKQAGNVRYWASAARNIAAPVPTEAAAKRYKPFLKDVREFLKR